MENENEEGQTKRYERKPNFNTRAKLSQDGRYWIIERIETWILPRKYLDVIAQNHGTQKNQSQDATSDAKPKKKGKRDANGNG